MRSVGEAVERLALHPGGPSRRGRWADVADEALAFFDETHSLGRDPHDRELTWYTGSDVRTGRTILVPAGLVDYPSHEADATGFDPGPSGTAAGSTWEAALKGALLETIERDAVIVAWARQLRLTSIDVDATLASGRRDPAAALLRDTVGVARATGLEPIFAEVPRSVDGVTCVVAGLRGPTARGAVLCLGASASDVPVRAMLSAFEESFQLYYYLRENPGQVGREPQPGAVRDEMARIHFLAGDDGRRALEGWLDGADPARAAHDGTELDSSSLLERCMADGLDPIVLDLTLRLPEGIRQDGWHVAKVVPAGFQPLRIDEATEFGWNARRLASAPSRTGSPARAPVDAAGLMPHPLP